MAEVLVIRHVPSEGPGLIADALADVGVALRTVRVFDGEAVPREPGGAAGLVVMGGPMGVYEASRYGHLRDELALIEATLREGVPVLGVCLGSQLLARALGAEVRPGAAREIGWLPITLTPEAERDTLLGGAPRTFSPLHWHGDVFSLPTGATSLARSAMTAHQAFRYDGAGAPAYGLLFHLEATASVVAAMATAFADEARAAGADPDALVAAAPARLAALVPVARSAFARWAALVVGEPPYLPVDCGFHDRLEDLAVRHIAVEAAWVEPDGTVRREAVRVADVFARGGADHVELAPVDTGAPFEVRLDRLVSVGGVERRDGPAC